MQDETERRIASASLGALASCLRPLPAALCTRTLRSPWGVHTLPKFRPRPRRRPRLRRRLILVGTKVTACT